jgi:hypothetical protein
MTKAEWLTCIDPQPMLDFLPSRASERKLQLFACACARRFNDLLTEDGKRAVEISEMYADGEATTLEQEAARQAAWYAAENRWSKSDFAAGDANRVAWAVASSTNVASNTVGTARRAAWGKVQPHGSKSIPAYGTSAWRACEEARELEAGAQCHLLRDVFGNPFRAVTISPACRTANVIGLAQSIYADRAFERLPILADALEDAGCDNVDILNHCRQPGEHVRGCWVVDLILEKE